MDKMLVRAAVLDSARPKKLDIQEFEIPKQADEDQLVLKTELAGICGSDLRSFMGGSAPGKVIPGHEFVGTIVSIGNNFRDPGGIPLKVGERVAVESTIPCGICAYCRGEGSRYDKWVDNAVCQDYLLFGNNPLREPIWLSGGYSEIVQIPRLGRVHKIPQKISDDEAVLLEPLAVAVRAVLRAGVSVGDTVVVQGPGPIGLLCLVAAQIAGALTVMLIGIDGDEARLNLGQELGADRTVNVAREDCGEALLDLTNGEKAARVIDASGSATAFWEGVKMTAKGGVYVNIGGFGADQEISIFPDYLLRNKIDIRFSHTGANCYQRASQILQSKRFALRKLITRRVRLEGVEEALQRLLERNSDDVKVVIEMTN